MLNGLKANKFINFFAVLSATILLGCQGSADDPKTEDQGEFNPPGNLQTITMDKKIVLTWIGANAEDDFQGYHVFGVKGAISELGTVTFPTYNSAAPSLAAGQSIPRCKDNTAFFEKFGFPASDATCKSSVAAAAGSTPDTKLMGALADKGSSVSADSTSTTSSEVTIDFNLSCTGSGQRVEDGSLSIKATEGKTLGRVFCDVEQVYASKDANGKAVKEAIANGSVYTFFVVAVKGSKFNNISWTSAVVQDTAAKQLYAGNVTLARSPAAQYVAYDINSTTFATLTAPTATTCTTTDICQITGNNGTNQTANAANSIFLARDGYSGTYQQRLMISTASTTNIELEPRGSEVWLDPRDNKTVLAQKPGDQAGAAYSTKGSIFPVYGNQVFDLKITNGSTINYGKFVVRNLTYASNATTADATAEVTIVVQTKAGSFDYLK